MGAFTPNAQVWYPGTGDTAELNTLLATMASSIEEGLEPRLAHQEIAVGGKYGCPLSYTHPTGTAFANATLVPFTMDGLNSGFQSGITISSSVVTIATAGMYIVTASLSGFNTAARSVVTYLCKNGAAVASAEVPSASNVYVSSQANCVLNLIAGDTISVRSRSTGGSLAIGQDPLQTYLTLAMVQAAPL